MTLLFGFVLGVCVTSAAFWLIGEWLRWRGTIEFRDDQESRIRSLDPMSDDWWPQGPRRVK